MNSINSKIIINQIYLIGKAIKQCLISFNKKNKSFFK